MVIREDLGMVADLLAITNNEKSAKYLTGDFL
jgi:hypothetical protein